MKKILNALFLTIVTLVTFSACSDVPSPYDVPGSGNGDGPAISGEGTKENPYDVAAALVKQDGSVAWVQGYIVGSINNIYDDKGEFAGNEPAFAAPFNVNTNILIAASATEKDYNKCLPVKLKAAELRAALNVMDNASVLGKAIIIEGKLAAGFGRSALIETTAAMLDGKDVGSGTTPEPPTDLDNPFGLDTSSPVASLNATFDDATNQKDYTSTTWKNKALKGDRVWRGVEKDGSKYLQATAHDKTDANKGVEYESWLVSPAFTVNTNVKEVTFDCAGAYYNPTTSLKVFFLELENGKMKQTPIEVSNIPATGTDYAWTTGLKADLTPFVSKVGFIAFKYTAIGGNSSSTTYQIDNVKYGESGGVDPNPEPEPEAGVIFEENFGSVDVAKNKFKIKEYTGWDNKDLTFTDAYGEWADIRTTGVMVNAVWFPATTTTGATPTDKSASLKIAGFSTTGYTKLKLSYSIATQTKDKDQNIIKVKCGDTMMTVPSKVLDKYNEYYSVELTDVPTNITSIEFISDATNTIGFRIDNVKLTGEK